MSLLPPQAAVPAAPPASAPLVQQGAERSQRLLEQCLARWRESGRTQDLWLFAYGSLIWRPDLELAGQQPARVLGYHRALRMRSRINRGTPEQPGLVLALLSGGSCQGLLYRIEASRAEASLRQLWEREMPSGVYDPRWLNCHGAQGPRSALAFTLSRRSPSWTGAIDDERLLHILRHARGRYGSTLDYLRSTVHSLRAHGIRDRELERQYHLAAAHGLCEALPRGRPGR